MTEVLAAVDLSGMSTFAIAAGVAIVGVALVFAGVKLSKRAVSRV